MLLYSSSHFLGSNGTICEWGVLLCIKSCFWLIYSKNWHHFFPPWATTCKPAACYKLQISFSWSTQVTCAYPSHQFKWSRVIVSVKFGSAVGTQREAQAVSKVCGGNRWNWEVSRTLETPLLLPGLDYAAPSCAANFCMLLWAGSKLFKDQIQPSGHRLLPPGGRYCFLHITTCGNICQQKICWNHKGYVITRTWSWILL